MKITLKTVKRIIAVVMTAILLFSLASCKDNPAKNADEIVVPEKKVAILVAPEAQYPEDYRAAQELAAEYPDTIIVKEYEDSRILKGGNPGIMTLSDELANNPEIGAIIYARATQFTRNAIYNAKQINPNLITVCIEPEEKLSEMSDLADLVYAVDWAKAADDIVAQAKAQGAKYFVAFAIPRTLGGTLVSEQISALEKACNTHGLTYIYKNSEDTNKSTQIAGAQKFIKEAVARLYLNKEVEGNAVALYSADSSVQSTLIEQAEARELIYVCPSFPTAYNGIGEVYEIAAPEKVSDVAAYIKSAKSSVKENASGKANLSIYKNPLATILLKGAVHSTFDLLNGTMTAENMAEKAPVRVQVAADSKDFTVVAHAEYTNIYIAYQPGFEELR